MFAEAAFAEISFGEGLTIGPLIIPEVGLETKQLVILIEIDLVRTGE